MAFVSRLQGLNLASRILSQSRRNASRDADDFLANNSDFKNAMPIFVFMSGIAVWQFWRHNKVTCERKETEICISPMSERERDPNMNNLAKTFEQSMWTQIPKP